MRKIIGGKVYDTDTAQKIADYWNGLGGNDFRNISEDLYLKRTGEYFLYGEGGPMTRYAVHNGNSSSEGSRIIPLTEAEAKEWVEANDNSKYEAIFGEIDEGEERLPLSILVTKAQREKLDSLKACTGKSITAIIAGLIDSLDDSTISSEPAEN